jgi:FdhD protein
MNECPVSEVMVSATVATTTTGEYAVQKWQDDSVSQIIDCVAEEVPIALVYNGISHAVMLASPSDLSDFAIGFSFTEGIISQLSDIYDIEEVPQCNGIELHITIATECFQNLKEKRRNMTGRTGCGLCGAESLGQAMRMPQVIFDAQLNGALLLDAGTINHAAEALKAKQQLQNQTGATHASAWVDAQGQVLLVREDVGRHNALDKLIGAVLVQKMDKRGFVITTSRASYEMVQKTASAGIAVLVAISAPTGLAVRIAKQCGMTLIGFTRPHQHVVYCGLERMKYKEIA